MQRPYRSPQGPKADGGGPDLTPDQAQPPLAAPRYQVVGLAIAERMLIDFQGRLYDLANLSDEDVALLRQFPDQVPYLA